jgi:ABC-type glycerol-3-phosphate transport system substrate-binding protein
MYDAELIQDLTEIQAENIPAAALNVGQYDGAQIGLPYRLSGVVLYRNQSIIPTPAADFADLKAKAEAAATEEIDGALLEIGSFYSFSHLYGLGGALMTPEGDPAFNTPEGVAWLEMLQDFYALGADDWYNDNDIERFKEGKVGFVIDGTWNMADFSASLGDDLVIDPWPADMSGFVQTSMLYLNANTTGENTGAVKSFIAYLLEEESQTIFYEADETFLPANTRVEVPDPLRQQALAALEGGVSWIVIPEMGA